jgi:hypothetical protein
MLSTKKTMRDGDVVISRLRSYLKQIAVVRLANGEVAVGSSEFYVLRPIADLKAEALLAYLRSDLVQTVLKWSQDGTAHPRFDEATLLSLPVPQALIDQQDTIARSINDAISARQKMKTHLARADSLIVNEIEAGV